MKRNDIQIWVKKSINWFQNEKHYTRQNKKGGKYVDENVKIIYIYTYTRFSIDQTVKCSSIEKSMYVHAAITVVSWRDNEVCMIQDILFYNLHITISHVGPDGK